MNPTHDKELQQVLLQNCAHQVVRSQRRQLLLWKIWAIAGWVVVLLIMLAITYR